MTSPDGERIGQGYIEIGTELNQRDLRRTQETVEDHLRRMGRAAAREWTRQNRDLMGQANNQFAVLHRGQAKAAFAQYREEMKAAQALERQRQIALKKSIQDTQFQVTMNRQQQRETLAAQKAALEIEKAHHQAILENRRRTEAIQKTHHLALIENQKRDDVARRAEIRGQQERMRAIEQAANTEIRARERAFRIETQQMREATRAAKAAQAEMDKIFRDSVKRGLTPPTPPGTPPGRGGGGGTGGAGGGGGAGARPPDWRATGNALNRVSETLGQISTRVGIAAFQMQMLGVMLSQAITAPVLQGFIQLSTVGLEFAVNIDYARASMKALLGPTADVEQILNDIKQITIDSPLFAADDAIKYAQQLAAAGVAGRDLVPTMEAMSNIFLTQGVAGPERATLAMLAYTQMLSKGAIGMDDLRQQFAEHVPGGIKIFEEVARRLGFKSLDQLRDAMEKGKISAAELNAEFIELGTSQKFLEGGAEAAETLGGVWQSFTEEIVTRVGSAFDANRHAIIRAINGIRPVVMAFIDWFVKSLPAAIDALNRLVDKVRDWKAAYDALTPAQRELVNTLGLLVLAAGPAAVALGILGTALSTVTNAASLLGKILALGAGGAGIGAAGATILSVAGAVIALGAALTYAYNKSEPFRKQFLQIANVLKDMFATTVLPLLDYIWMRLQQIGALFESIGVDTKDFAYILWLLAIPLAAVLIPLLQIALALETIRFGFVAVYGVVDLLSEAFAGLVWVLAQVIKLLAKLPGKLGDSARGALPDVEGVEQFSRDVHDYFNTPAKFRVATTDKNIDKNATDQFAQQLKDLDLTATGLTGAFDGWGTSIDGVTAKEITLEQAIQNARRAMDGQNSAAAGAVGAMDAYKRSKIALSESIARNKRTLSDESKEGLANRDALKLAAQASYELMLQQIRSGVPYEEAIKNHKARTDALAGEFGKAKEVRAEARKLIETYGQVPPDVKTLLELMGYKDVNAKMIDLLAKQQAAKSGEFANYSKYKHAIEKQSRLASGGEVRGPGGPTGDKIPAWLSDREYVIRSRSARALGKPMLDYLNEHGSLPAMYAKGGAVEWPYKFDVSKSHVPGFLGGNAGGGGLGSARMMTILRGAFPGLAMLSGYRPGAVTSTGNQSYHALDRAVDVPPRWDVFNWIRENYGKGTKELIFTPAGGLQIKNGRNHVFSGGTVKEDHFDHVHWAYDNGGIIPPGRVFQNSTNTSELALNAAQGRALEDRIRNSDRPMNVSVYVDGVRRDAEIVWDERADELARLLGGGV